MGELTFGPHHTLSLLPIFSKAISKKKDLVIVNIKIESVTMVIRTHLFGTELSKKKIPRAS